MGGNDENENLVALTPEEHFTAHVLLVKMYPEQSGLIAAVNKMCRGKGRSRNKMYGWLKRRFSEEQSRAQSGAGNSQHGLMWVCNIETRQNKKLPKDHTLEEGWMKGRNMWNRSLCACGAFKICDYQKCADCLEVYRNREKPPKRVAAKRPTKIKKPKIREYRRRVICDGIAFESLTSASRFFGTSVETVRNRIKSGTYNWVDLYAGRAAVLKTDDT